MTSADAGSGRRVCGALLAAIALAGSPAAAGDGLATAWSGGYNSRVRLIAGVDASEPASAGTAAAGQGRASRVIAGIELEMPPGWKTYWRNPGDAGIPPSFDWSQSGNVAAASVLYPAPRRLVDKSGTTIGYMDRVTFPVRIDVKDASQPVTLRVTVGYGVCKDICVPGEAQLAIDIDTAASLTLPAALATALDGVPRPSGKERSDDPVVLSMASDLAGPRPHLTFDVRVPGGAGDAELFLVADDGGFVPMPERVPGADPASARFVVDLSRDVDVKDLKGRVVLGTLTSPRGASEVAMRLD